MRAREKEIMKASPCQRQQWKWREMKNICEVESPAVNKGHYVHSLKYKGKVNKDAL